MKTILLHINDDDGAEARLQVALELARVHGGHLECLQATPLNAYVANDMLGGVFVMADLMTAVQEQEDRLRASTEARLAREDVPWAYEHCEGEPAYVISTRARLADVVVLSRASRIPGARGPLPIAGDVALHARTPVLAVPPDAARFDATGPAIVAWNGSAEAANALKGALPMLRRASAITLVEICEENKPEFPATGALNFLARHGIKAELDVIDREGGTVSQALIKAQAASGAAYLVMGAYGHSRAREYLIGGVTRHMLGECPVPLLLGH